MKDIEFEDTRPGLSSETIISLETQLGIALPSSYREFLGVDNGGRPSLGYFYLPGFNDSRWVDWLCWVDEHLAEPYEFSDYDTLSFAQFRDSDIVPQNTLVIGVCCRDDLLLIVLDGKDRGKVQYKQVGQLPGFSRQAWRDVPTLELYPLADSFEEFLELLHGE